MSAKELKKEILMKLSSVLKSDGFKLIGNTFTASNNSLKYYINVQSSQESTSAILKFTLNIEISSKELFKIEKSSIPEKDVRHFYKRIGFYLELPIDKWWLVSNLHEVEIATGEILNLLESKVLPELATLQTMNDLAELWRNNLCPGLTETQRKNYLLLIEQ